MRFLHRAAVMVLLIVLPCGVEGRAEPGRTGEDPERQEEKEQEKKRASPLWNRLRADKDKDKKEDGSGQGARSQEPGRTAPAAAPPTASAPENEKPKTSRSSKSDAAAAAASGSPKAHVPAGRTLAKVRRDILLGPLADDRVVLGYLGAIERGEATAEHLNDFAVYLGRKGYSASALDVQTEVVRHDPKTPLFWINLGTLHRDVERTGRAKRDFRKAIALDPNSAFAYYNLGALLDAEGNYDEAIELFKKALRLDPSLADPRRNPQVVNNQRLMAVNLLLYRERAGALGLPLLPTPPAEGAPPSRAKTQGAEDRTEQP